MDKKRDEIRWVSVAKSGVVGAGVSAVVTLALTAIFAGLVSKGTVDESSLGAATAAILILSSVCGALVAASVAGCRRLPVCLASGTIYLLLLLGCAVLLFDGVNGTIGATALMIFGGACAALLLGLKEGRGGKRRQHHKKRNW